MGEKEFKEWVEDAARQITKNRICLNLFVQAWEAAAVEDLAGVIGAVLIEGNDYEGVVNKVARELFPDIYYVQQLEIEIMQSKSHPSVVQARRWLQTTCAKYVRLCQRHSYPIGITDPRLRESAYRRLPAAIKDELRLSWKELT